MAFTRSAGAAALAALVALLVVLLVLPGVALAADPPTVARYDQTDSHISYTGSWDTFERTAAYQNAYGRANTRGSSGDHLLQRYAP